MMRRRCTVWLALVPALLLVGTVVRQSAEAAADDTIAKKAEGSKGEKAKKEEKKPDFPDFDDVAGDHQEIFAEHGERGFLPLLYDKKNDQLLAVIPSGMMNKNFLLATSIAGGPNYASHMWGSQVVYWQEMDKKLVLVAPELRYKDGGSSPVADAIKRTYTDRIILSTPILTKRGSDPVIDLGNIFKRDYAKVGRVFGGSMSPSLSRWSEYKVFPKNVELAVDAAIMQGQGGVRAEVHHSIIELPTNNGFEPREADSRIGYFLTVVKDWTTDHQADTVFRRYINRWDVRKAEPDKAVSDVDPEHRITFYIEKTVPVKYRRYVREGILEWNKAFEKAGYRNAIKVEQQTETVHAEKDPEDVRYAFFRWIVSGRTFAMGPSLANPLTGQILDADIVFDDSMARWWESQYAANTATGLSGASDPALHAFLTHHPQWAFQPLQEQLLPDSTQYAGIDVAVGPEVAPFLMNRQGYCTCGHEIVQEMAFNLGLLEASGAGDKSDEYVGQMIRYVTTHEVGHTLGLRHNFKASSWKSVDEILANRDADKPVSASVMDYTAALFMPDAEKQQRFASTAVGPYDEWAIEYGYAMPHEGSEHSSVKDMLKAIASRAAEPGLDYATDEDAGFFAPDPLVNRWDNGSDLLAYAKHHMDMVKRTQENMADWAVDDGESYHKLRAAFDTSLGEYARAIGFAGRYIGGQYLHRDHKGDPNARPPIEIVSAEKQRAALAFLVKNVFETHNFAYSPDLLSRLAAGRWGHWGSDAMDSQLDYPIHDRIAALQWRALFMALNPRTLDRVLDAELKVPAGTNALTVPELMTDVTNAVWLEVKNEAGEGSYTDRKPFVSSVRRSLQRQHLTMMLNHVLARPGAMASADIHAVASLNLQDLSKRIERVLKAGKTKVKLDPYSRAHLAESKSRIDRALEAEFEL